jgi:epoxyqueuosine reductase
MAFWAGEKEVLPLEKTRMLSKHKIIYGCDYCQLACPHNQPGQSDGGWPLLVDLLAMTKTEFNETYRGTAAGWRGLNVLKRNAVIAAAGDSQFRNKIEELARGEGLVARQAQVILMDLKSDE